MEIQWTYEVSINFGKSPLQATSRWQLPTMSRHQAVSELQFFSSIIDTLSSAPDTPISKFLAISDPELDEVWNWNTPLPPDLQTCMHELIAEQAEKQAVAARTEVTALRADLEATRLRLDNALRASADSSTETMSTKQRMNDLAGRIDEVRPVADIIHDMVREFRAVIGSLADRYG